MVPLVAGVAAAAVLLPAGTATAAGVPSGLLARMSLAQRVGQLLMVGVPATGPTAAQVQAVGQYHVGGVIFTGRSRRGTAVTAALAAGLQAAATTPGNAGVPLLVSADQEGGAVQVLAGPGFSTVPSALAQGREATTTLRQQARTWGGQLRSAGVRLNLAPVADTVPAGANNPPIGGFDRQFGSDPTSVATHASAFAAGMRDVGVIPTVKHFPGLGRVSANTDTSTGVTDRVTTRTDAYLAPFRTASRTGHPFVMVSTAIYSRIDPADPAAFSPTVISGMLRGDLAFTGVVISDDLGNAAQVRAVTPGARATRFVAAGGDVVLTVNPATLPAMYQALYARAVADAGFRARVTESAGRVLLAKQQLGLLGRAASRGDFTGDGIAERTVFRNVDAAWLPRGAATVRYGLPGDVPVAADYTGDGRTDQSVYRPSTRTWYVRGQAELRIGAAGDIPVPADYTGDGIADLAIFRPSDGSWRIRGRLPVGYGQSGDVPVQGDWTGDGIAELAVFRPSTADWYVRGRAPVRFGSSTDVLVPGDYTGDGRLDPAVFRRSTQVWYIAARGSLRYGGPTDRPVLDVTLLRRPL